MAWVQIEPELAPATAPEQGSLLHMHSVLNVLNVVQGELQFAHILLEHPPDLTESLAVCRDLTARLAHPEEAIDVVRQLPALGEHILQQIAEAPRPSTSGRDTDALLDECRANLESIMQVIDLRVREILARAQAPEPWTHRTPEQLVSKLRQVLDATAPDDEGDCLIELSVDPGSSSTVLIPTLFEDTMRDLVAHARKHTDPGGHITLHLTDDGAALELLVTDDGPGMPADEIERVTELGTTGSSVAPDESHGAGLGLSKAYWVTRQFGGEMWIDSALHRGTRIRIRMPREKT